MRARLLAPILLVALSTVACGSSEAPALASEPVIESQPPRVIEPVPTGPAAPPPALALLSASSRAALATSPLRMLVLPVDYAATSIVTSGEHWTAVSSSDGELTISIHATNLQHAVVSDDELLRVPPPGSSVRGEPARVTVNELIRSVAWTEGGVDFALEVECARPEDDARCTEPDFVLELAERLVPVEAGR